MWYTIYNRRVDFVVCSHDHRPAIASRDGLWMMDGGARAGNVGHAVVEVSRDKGRSVQA